MSITPPQPAWLLLLLLLAANAAADPFSGEFSGSLDGEIHRLSISGHARGLYEGQYRAGGEIMSLNARRFGDRLAGRIGIADFGFGFTAQLQGDALLLRGENGRVILFRRTAEAGAD